MGSQTDFLQFLMNPKKWWIPFTIIFSVSISGVAFIGYETYNDAPPLPSFLTKTKEFIFTKDDILKGQSVFQRYALMDYGSMFGDGANRGPDFTAQALHQTSVYMREFYQRQSGSTELEQLGIVRNAREKPIATHTTGHSIRRRETILNLLLWCGQLLVRSD
jgi:nitric oxide reductase subunit B